MNWKATVRRPMAEASRRSPAPVVVSVGGSVLATGTDDAAYFRDLAELLRKLSQQFSLVVTTGGGRTARSYIQLGRALGLTEVELDEVGIDVTRLHARLLAASIGPPAPAHPPRTIAEAVREAHRSPLVVLGGTEPGHTTDGVAALLAVRLRASRLVNATSVDGLFDADPRGSSAARRLDSIDWDSFRALVHRSSTGEAGQEFLFDRLGADALARAKIPLCIVNGRNLANLQHALTGASFVGTRVEG